MTELSLSFGPADHKITVTPQDLNGGDHADISQMCPVYNFEDICQNLAMVVNADPAAVPKKMRLSVNINYKTYSP
jgi:hypothetical protein